MIAGCYGLTELRATLQSLRRTPGFTMTVVLTLCLGIGGTTAIFSAVNQVLLEPLPFEEPDRLVRIYQHPATAPDESWYVSGPYFEAYRERTAALRAVSAAYTFSEEGANLELATGVERVRLLQITAEYFDVLGSPLLAGRGFVRDDELSTPGTIVLGAAVAERIFGGPAAALGGTVRLDGLPYTVVGVASAGLADPVVGDVDAWSVLDTQPVMGMENPQDHRLTVLARLAPHATLQQAQAELAALDAQLAEVYPAAAEMRTRVVGLHEDAVGAASRPLLVLLGAVGLLLLIVCVNVASLMLARATTQSRALAIRAALGSSRARIVAQLLTDSVVLAVAGGVLGVLFGAFLLDGIIALGGDVVPRLADAQYSTRVLAFAAVVSMGSAVLFGMLPALRFSRVEPNAVLSRQARGASAGGSANRLRAALVAAQVALAFMLVTGATVLAVSMQRLANVPLGFEPDGVLTFEVHLPPMFYDGARRAAFHEELATRLTSLAGVDAAGAVSRLPGTGSLHTWGTSAATGPLAGTGRHEIIAEQRVVAGRYFDVLGVRLLEGRLFDARDDAAAPLRVVIDRTAADRLFPGSPAPGHELLLAGRHVEIIGVVDDVALVPGAPSQPTVYHAHAQFAADRNWSLTQVARVAGRPSAALPAVRAELAALDAGLVLHRAQPFDEVLGRGTAQRRFTTWIMASFAVGALLLAALGLFGLTSYTVRQRRREFGIRSALGATSARIRALVVARGAAIVVVGIAFGLAGALALGRVIAALAFETSAADPLLLAAVAATLVAVSLTATLLPAREAARIEPRQVLEEE